MHGLFPFDLQLTASGVSLVLLEFVLRRAEVEPRKGRDLAAIQLQLEEAPTVPGLILKRKPAMRIHVLWQGCGQIGSPHSAPSHVEVELKLEPGPVPCLPLCIWVLTVPAWTPSCCHAGRIHARWMGCGPIGCLVDAPLHVEVDLM